MYLLINEQLYKVGICMSIKEIRVLTGLSQAKFANKFGIPVRTVQKWEIGQCKPPPYIPTMILKILEYEGVIDEKRVDKKGHRNSDTTG